VRHVAHGCEQHTDSDDDHAAKPYRRVPSRQFQGRQRLGPQATDLATEVAPGRQLPADDRLGECLGRTGRCVISSVSNGLPTVFLPILQMATEDLLRNICATRALPANFFVVPAKAGTQAATGSPLSRG
jgi:hypothetical protein